MKADDQMSVISAASSSGGTQNTKEYIRQKDLLIKIQQEKDQIRK